MKEEITEDLFPVLRHLPTDHGWAAEIDEAGGLVFAEIDFTSVIPNCFLPGTHFLTSRGAWVDVQKLPVGDHDQLEGPEGNACIQQVVELIEEKRLVIILKCIASPSQASSIIPVTGDHRMYLRAGVYRLASELRRGDVLCSKIGDLRIYDIERKEEETSVFQVSAVGDHAVFVSMPSMGSDVPVAAFGAPHQLDPEYVEFRFKGGICSMFNVAGSAQAWLAEFGSHLHEFRIQFLATAPYSVWVRRDSADRFYEAAKELLREHAPKGSRLRQHLSAIIKSESSVSFSGMQLLTSFRSITEPELQNSMPASYED